MANDFINTNPEDLKIYFYDMFLSSEMLTEELTLEAYNVYDLGEIQMSTGIQANSTSNIYYERKEFNPRYSELTIKLRLDSVDDVFAFFGFRSNNTDPTASMTESHIGIMIESGKVYVSSADDDHQQKTEIISLDMTKLYEFKFLYDKLYIKPLPYLVEELGLPVVMDTSRKWGLLQQNSTYPPLNQMHFIEFFIKSTTNTEKNIYLNRVIYKEEYPD